MAVLSPLPLPGEGLAGAHVTARGSVRAQAAALEVPNVPTVPQSWCENPKVHGCLQAKTGRIKLPKYMVTVRSLIVI